jgi:hypothetical protein
VGHTAVLLRGSPPWRRWSCGPNARPWAADPIEARRRRAAVRRSPRRSPFAYAFLVVVGRACTVGSYDVRCTSHRSTGLRPVGIPTTRTVQSY